MARGDHTESELCTSSQAEISKHPRHLQDQAAVTHEIHQKGTAKLDEARRTDSMCGSL